MFETLFQTGYAVARHYGGPLQADRLAYLAHLSAQGALRQTLRVAAEYLLTVAHRLHLADRPNEIIAAQEIEIESRRWARRSSSPGGRHRRAQFRRHATQWLAFLGRLEVQPPQKHPHADLLSAFAAYMQDDRGLSPATIYSRCSVLKSFLDPLGSDAGVLASLSIAKVDDLLIDRVTRGGYARATVQLLASTLRAFFRFAESQGACPRGLAAAITAPRVFPDERLPLGPPWEQVQRLLETTKGNRPSDIRDRAILLLLAVYGLRVSEVLGLRLDDFDWEHELLLVRRSKTKQAQPYPLSRTVGDAVLRYLRQVRPRCLHREVFLSRYTPYGPLHSGIWRIVSRRLQQLCQSIPHHGPHALRHACATHLLSQGLSLKEIGDHLGHQSPDTTRIYAKVDLAGLRQVADFDLGGLR